MGEMISIEQLHQERSITILSATLWLFNVAMENPNQKWRFLAGKITYFNGPCSMAMLNNQRV